MGLKNFSTVLYRLWRGGFKKVAFTNFRPDRHILSRADGRSENLGLVMWWAQSAPLVLMELTDLPKSWGGGGKCPLAPKFHRPCSDIYSSIFLFFLLELSRWPLGQHRSYNAHYILAHTGQEKQCERLRLQSSNPGDI